MQHTQDNQEIRPSQPEFMKATCCLTGMISCYDRVTHLVDEWNAADVLHLHFGKASDTHYHDILLEKMAAHSPIGAVFTG